MKTSSVQGKLRRPDVLFVFPRTKEHRPDLGTESFSPCLGAAYLVANLRRVGVNAEIYTTCNRMSASQVVTDILKRRPRVVGFTVYNMSYGLCSRLAHELKTADPGISIVFGGPTPTVSAGDIMRTGCAVDVCVRHEADDTVAALLSALADCTGRDLSPLEAIPGLTFRLGGEIVETDLPKWQDWGSGSLDRFPSPYLEGVLKNAKAGVITARGCNQNCTFCNCAMMSHRRVRTHTVQRVLEELSYIQHLCSHPEEVVQIHDDAFTLMPQRAIAICQGIIRQGIALRLGCLTRCDLVSHDMLDLMKAAGFVRVSFSLESASPRVLRAIGKVQPPDTLTDPSFEKEKAFIEAFHDATSYAKRIGLVVSASVMVGLPDETPEDAKITINFINSLQLNSYFHNSLHVYPGTPLFHDHSRYGIGVERREDGVTFVTRHAFDPWAVPLGLRSQIQRFASGDDCRNIKVLSGTLDSDGSDDAQCINNVVLKSDRLSDKFASWMTGVHAIGGRLIQVFSSLEAAGQCFEECKRTLKRNGDYTATYNAYYVDTDREVQILRPYREILGGVTGGQRLEFIPLSVALSEREARPWSFLCVATALRPEESIILHDWLLALKVQGDQALDSLIEYAPASCFEGLCRWCSSGGNCQSVQTLYVDSNYNISVCQNGPSIGQVGATFRDLMNSLRLERSRVEEDRQCSSCVRCDSCSKCPFLGGIDAEEFCSRMRTRNVAREARLVNSLKIITERIAAIQQ